MILDTFCKGAREALDYVLDFTRTLAVGETITSASAVVAPDTITLSRVEFTDFAVAVWLAGGVDRERYTVTVSIDTSQGRRFERSFLVQVEGDSPAIAQVSVADTTATIGYTGD